MKIFIQLFISIIFYSPIIAQKDFSVARIWNDALLEAIRIDFARPPVHARNIFHTSIAIYDAWAVYDEDAKTYFLGNTIGNYTCDFNGIDPPSDLKKAREEAISYAVYRLLRHRFKNSPGVTKTYANFDSLMNYLGYDINNTSSDYINGAPASLGNYIGQSLIDFGLLDGCNEQNDYKNLYYKSINPPLAPKLPGNENVIDPNRWQPLTLDVFIDQSGHTFIGKAPDFLSPEWGKVIPFALTNDYLKIYNRDENEYWVYHDPGDPPYIDTEKEEISTFDFQWGFSLVSIWASHLDPTDGILWDISPASIGNNTKYPQSSNEMEDFYKLLEGGDSSLGHKVNPRTGHPYKPQFVPRGDYTRVLAEFWADGPHSETPPGHWVTILNYVSDHPGFIKKFKGEGLIMDNLEWDVKAYFSLGGAVHDAAVAAWGIKGWYDYVRPISAIRWMADNGQSSEPNHLNYSLNGIPLVPDYVEMVEMGDPLAGENGENIGKIKLFTWKGPNSIYDSENGFGGVDWILAENWWPYQRPTFVTPPFAGYISGHSTFSRAAAEVLTLITGDPYFPGGLGEFPAKKNEFLVFEEGPSVDITLQWATYRDASDQCSLSRIWGGIHPPADDIPGRLIGEKIGVQAFTKAESYFSGKKNISSQKPKVVKVFPNPIEKGAILKIALDQPITKIKLEVINIQGQIISSEIFDFEQASKSFTLETNFINSGLYILRMTGNEWAYSYRFMIE